MALRPDLGMGAELGLVAMKKKTRRTDADKPAPKPNPPLTPWDVKGF